MCLVSLLSLWLQQVVSACKPDTPAPWLDQIIPVSAEYGGADPPGHQGTAVAID